MNEVISFTLASIAGLGLGFFYFGGLWLTVQRLTTTRQPTVLTLGSFIARTGLTIIGFYFVTGGDLLRLAGCIIGFLLIRIILVHRWGPK